MSAERMKVLELLAAGKITAADADRLLGKLESGGGERAATSEGGRDPKYLRIEVDEPEEEKVRMRVPLGFLRAGLKLGSIIPEKVRARLSSSGFTFIAGNDTEEIIRLLQKLDLDVKEGTDTHVRIWAE